MQVKIMPLAEEQSLEILDYLLHKFGQKARNDFSKLLVKNIDIIGKHSEAFPQFRDNLHRAVITKHNTMFDRINNDKEIVEVIAIFDTRQHPEKLNNEL